MKAIGAIKDYGYWRATILSSVISIEALLAAYALYLI